MTTRGRNTTRCRTTSTIPSSTSAATGAAALVALGDLKDRGLLAFFKERFAKDGSDAVRAESLRAIGKAGDRSAIPFLEKCAEVPSFRNLIATAAKQAMKSAGAPEER